MNKFKRTPILDFTYNSYWRTRNARLRSELFSREKIFTEWIPSYSTILDMAAGNSFLPSFLKKEKKAHVTIFDIAESVVFAQRGAGLDARVVDITDPDLRLDVIYDYVVLSEIIEHLAVPERLIGNIRNNARYIIFSIPNAAYYPHRFSMLCGRFLGGWAAHPAEHLRYWSHVDFIDWLAALDLRIIAHKPANGFDLGMRLYRFWPNLFANQICYLVEPQ